MTLYTLSLSGMFDLHHDKQSNDLCFVNPTLLCVAPCILIKKKIFLTASPSPQFGWLGPDPEPWVFRGGLSGEFQVKLFF